MFSNLALEFGQVLLFIYFKNPLKTPAFKKKLIQVKFNLISVKSSKLATKTTTMKFEFFF